MSDRRIRMEGRGEVDPDQLHWMEARKKPVVVEATPMPAPFEVETMEGTMQGDAEDVLIKGVEGELYPCSIDVFSQTYDLVGVDDVEEPDDGVGVSGLDLLVALAVVVRGVTR